MSFSNAIILTIDISGLGDLEVTSIYDDPESDSTRSMFNILGDNESVSFMGSWEDIMAFVARVGSEMYAWAITNGHTDWLGNIAESAELRGNDNDGNGSNTGE